MCISCTTAAHSTKNDSIRQNTCVKHAAVISSIGISYVRTYNIHTDTHDSREWKRIMSDGNHRGEHFQPIYIIYFDLNWRCGAVKRAAKKEQRRREIHFDVIRASGVGSLSISLSQSLLFCRCMPRTQQTLRMRAREYIRPHRSSLSISHALPLPCVDDWRAKCKAITPPSLVCSPGYKTCEWSLLHAFSSFAYWVLCWSVVHQRIMTVLDEFSWTKIKLIN